MLLLQKTCPGTYGHAVVACNDCVIGPIARRCLSGEATVVCWDAAAGGYPEPPLGRPKGPAVFAGSFNPPHLGHLAVLAYAAKRHKQVHAVIGVNPKKVYPVTGERRKAIMEAMLRELALTNVSVEIYGGLVWKFARSVGARTMYRGIRTWEEDGEAERVLEVQNACFPMLIQCSPPMRTEYIQGPPQFAHVSSTLLRTRLQSGDSIDDLVCKGVAKDVKEAYAYLLETKV